MNSHSRRIRTMLVVAVALAVAGVTSTPASTRVRTENFDVDPGWTGLNNTGYGSNNYGFSNTANAGGSAGELGGVMLSRTISLTYYGDTTHLSGLSEQTSLFASGRFTATDTSAFDGGFELGWFNPASPRIAAGSGVGGPAEAIALRFIDRNIASFRLQARQGNNGSATILELGNNIDFLFDLGYDPNGAGAGTGRLDLTIRLASDNSLVGTASVTGSSVGTPWNLNTFGLYTLDFDTNLGSQSFFLDNLTYTYTIPEPSTVTLGAVAGLCLAAWRRRGKRAPLL